MQFIVRLFLVEREFRNGFPFFLLQIYQVFVTNNLTFYPYSVTKSVTIYPCFVTNICHYFDLLEKICGKLYVFTYL